MNTNFGRVRRGGRNLAPAPFFLPLLPQGGEGRGEEANVYKLEPVAPALSPFGRGKGVVSFGACVKMRSDETPDARPND
jgi:hypothetical protein